MVWLIGARGMLGTDVGELLGANNIVHTSSDVDVDIGDYQALANFSSGCDIDWIVNCAAYTQVDKAEGELELAERINADGVRNIARLAADLGARLIHISTDYVFDGRADGEYREDDHANPIGAYGISKLHGEENVLHTIKSHFILRTAWLYGKNGANFAYTMLRLFRERDTVRVVSDQHGSPTWSRDLAGVIVDIISRNSDKFGIYHYSNGGKTNWYEFASEIYRLARKYELIDKEVIILPIRTEDYPTRAARPKNSCLSKEKITRVLGVHIRDWKDSLEEFIRVIGAGNG